MKICQFPNCNRKHDSKGYCIVHYHQLIYTGEVKSIRPRFGYKQSEATKEKMSRKRMGIKLSLKTRKKMSISRSKGGLYFNAQGYLMIVPRRKVSNKRVREDEKYRKPVPFHRVVMENYLGRELKPEEVVHHIDEDKSNNDISNLKLFETTGKHLSFHKNQKFK